LRRIIAAGKREDGRYSREKLPTTGGAIIETAPRVLVVDDHLMMRQFVCKALRDSCAITDIQTAEDGVQAGILIERATANGRPFGIVLLDWNMPNMSGLEVLD
jgi:two-component system, chemotaxis family, chemotaxis protein CheY